MSVKLDLVIPLAPNDVSVFLKGIIWIKTYIPFKRMIVIGNNEVKKMLIEYQDIIFMNEEDMISYSEIYRIIAEISKGDSRCTKRTGWYLQQFLKMKYAYLCEDEYYLLWDGDSIPTHRLHFFEEGRPIFGQKEEFCEAYFRTMAKLIPQLKKSTKYSYISEHMVISVSLMKELVQRIEMNALSGMPFYETILRNIDINDLDKSGFSEFETYGTFCKIFHSDCYVEKKWNSLRPANYYFDIDKLRKEDLDWLSGDYDAISFEFYESQDSKKRIIDCLHFIFGLKCIRKLFTCHTLNTPIEKIRYIRQRGGNHAKR